MLVVDPFWSNVAVVELGAACVGVGSVTGPLAGRLEEPSRLRPVKSCRFDLRVVDTYGLRVDVVVDEGAGVVVELDVAAPSRVALSLVWNLLLRLPNFLLVEALPLSEDSVVSAPSLIGAGVVVVVDVVVVVVVMVGCETGRLLLIETEVVLDVVETLVDVVDGGLTDVVTCTCCGVKNDLETEVLIGEDVNDDNSDTLPFVVPNSRCRLFIVGVAGEVAIEGNGDRVNPFPVLPSLVVGRPLLNELEDLGACESESVSLCLPLSDGPTDMLVVVLVVLARRAWGIKRVDEKV